ncbi:pre-rRNA-processing protein IPI1 [Diaporthe helianthi]|uniref:Pre-rRNA-processing protein IPI1 n=1 Tax=Diaporthe helianthi TaxID=158607 RepID=A0A2P5I5H4_DIAHE|nr:pre-rRNA-processing protein IPI1 [Diaporthe helianthi]
MGSSARKKKEKKKDFQASIVVNQQSLSEIAPDDVALFKHNLSLATSRTDKQRREALSHLISQLTSTPPKNPVGAYVLLDKLLPLITDTSSAIRSSLLKLFQALPYYEVQPHSDKVVKWVRLGMLHLSAEVRDDALKFMDWLLDVAVDQLLDVAGGWTKTLDAFVAMMGWRNATTASAAGAGKGWSSAPKTTFGADKGGSAYAHQMTALAKFIQLGLQKPPPVKPWTGTQYWEQVYRLPEGPNPFGYLQLLGPPQDGEICADTESRLRALWPLKDTMEKKTAQARVEGGPAGRAATDLAKALQEGFKGYEHDELEELDW